MYVNLSLIKQFDPLVQLRVPIVEVEKAALHVCLPCLYLSLALTQNTANSITEIGDF